MTDSPNGIDAWTKVSDVLADDRAVNVLRINAPDLLIPAQTFAGFPLGIFLKIQLRADPASVDRVLDHLKAIPDPSPPRAIDKARAPAADYEDLATAVGSARVDIAAHAGTDQPIELVISGPSHGNPFVDVELTAEFHQGSEVAVVGGFYDGLGVYRIRFLAPEPGIWKFTTSSNARSLDGLVGDVVVHPSAGRGPVRVQGSGFAHADGTPFVPFGTTAYAWTHQPEAVQNQTLASLATAPFNKLRMGLFPKSFIYNENDPENYVFPRTEDGGWDFERFDLDFFRHLEGRIHELGALGIEADLILFHPYDRWGFSELSPATDDRYVRYVIRRLAGFTNIWWSLANEYELLTAKRPDDWNRLGRLVEAEDHVRHPRSIHNIVEPWDTDSPWVTHASIQLSDPSIGDRTEDWRGRWPAKPVVIDEMGYDGDLDQGWGSLPAEELLIRFWQVTLRGGYATHGETIWRDDELIFWAKGGTLVGESPARIGFLREIVAESPTGRIDALLSQFDAVWGGVADRYVLIHFGRGRPAFRNVPVPDGFAARLSVIDSWNMTIEEQPGVHTGTVRISLPGRQHIVVRLVLEKIHGE